MNKTIYLFTIIFFLTIFSPVKVFAAKKRIWKTTSVSTATAIQRPSIYVTLRKDRRALNISFTNLQTVNFSLGGVSYELTYVGNEIEQGVVGSVSAEEGNSTTRQLLFGTCSHNVCTYHNNIQNALLKITVKLKNGKTLIKRYKIKV